MAARPATRQRDDETIRSRQPFDSVLGGVREGLATPWHGFLFMKAHRRLWRYAAIPILLNVLITCFILILLVGLATWFVVSLHPRFAQAWWGRVLEILAAVALLLTAIVLTMGVWVLLNGILCGVFHAKLARQVELLLGMRPEDMREICLRHQIADAVRDTAQFLSLNAVLLALNIIPGLGTLAALLLGGYFNGMMLGSDYLEYPMGLRGMRRADQRAFAKRHRGPTIGLGLAVFVMSWIPVVGSVFLATACCGAVLLYRRLSGGLTR